MNSDIPEALGKLKELKIKRKNINVLTFPAAKTSDTMLYIDDKILKVKTMVKIDGTLEIFIENPEINIRKK